MPFLRQTSLTCIPASASFKIHTSWFSVNLKFLMGSSCYHHARSANQWGVRIQEFHPEGWNWAMNWVVVRCGMNEFRRGWQNRVKLRIICVKSCLKSWEYIDSVNWISGKRLKCRQYFVLIRSVGSTLPGYREWVHGNGAAHQALVLDFTHAGIFPGHPWKNRMNRQWECWHLDVECWLLSIWWYFDFAPTAKLSRVLEGHFCQHPVNHDAHDWGTQNWDVMALCHFEDQNWPGLQSHRN